MNDIVINETKISQVNENSVYYRGYDIRDLTATSSFEEVSFLLVYGELPKNERELSEYRSEISHYRYIPESLKEILEKIPVYAHPIDVLKIACSFYTTISPESKQNDIYRIANRLIGSFPSILLYWYHFTNSGIKINTTTNPNDSFSRHFLKLLYNNNNNNNSNQEPEIENIRALDVSLILYSEHYHSSSTYSSRLTASTGSDVYSCITSAISTMKGRLDDGSSSESVMYLLSQFSSPESADSKIMNMINKNQKVIGFSNEIDKRTSIIKEWSRQLSTSSFSSSSILRISERVEEIMFDIKKLNANVDFYNAVVLNQMNIPTFLFSAISILASTTGWIANIIEQRSSNKPLNLPSLVYTGTDPIPFPPMNERFLQHNFKLSFPHSNL